MKLDDYLRAHDLTSAQFGQMSGIGSKQLVHNYRHGLRFPTPENLRLIREATKGAVMPDDFVDQHAGASPPYPEPVAPIASGKPKRAGRPPKSARPPASSSDTPPSQDRAA